MTAPSPQAAPWPPGAVRMQVWYPRLLGGLALVWSTVLQRGALDWPSEVVWALYTGAWLVAALALVAGRATVPAAAVVAVLALALWAGWGRHLSDPLVLFWWLGLAVAVTDRRPLERALLVRVTVTVAYAFACLTKLNPSFLAGEQIVALAVERSQLHPFEELFRGPVGVVVAWATVVAEGALAAALWFPRTRTVAAAGGFLMSLVFIYAAHNPSVWDVAFIIVLTMLLVVSYLAFFAPIPTRAPAADRPASPAR